MKFLFATVLLCLACDMCYAEKTQSPNIVLVLIDDMGWGDFSCFGNTSVETQNIDQLAKEGMRFEQFYVNSPICSPSRVAISTGQYPQRWKITSFLNNRQNNIERGMAQWLDPQAPMLARQLQAAGYVTGHFGKWHMGGQRDVGEAPLISEYGFDESLTNFEGLGPRVLPLKDAYDGKEPQKHALGSDLLGRGEIRWQDRSRVTQSFTAAALDFVKQSQAKQKPFYINVWPDDVHSPFFPPQARRGDGSKRTLYHGVLDTMDEQLGVLFDYIKGQESLNKNTLIVICSDNGPEPGAGSSGRFKGSKTMLYEGGIRSPLIVWGPKFMNPQKAGSVNNTSILAAIDLVPSLIKLSGASQPEGITFDGEELSQVFLGHSEASRSQPLFFRRPPDRAAFYGEPNLPDLSVRAGNWKLLTEYDGSNPQLYDLSVDAEETQNLAKENPKVVKRLSRALLEWHTSMPPDHGATYVEKSAKRKKG